MGTQNKIVRLCVKLSTHSSRSQSGIVIIEVWLVATFVVERLMGLKKEELVDFQLLVVDNPTVDFSWRRVTRARAPF
jgi:hypothetical protein